MCPNYRTRPELNFAPVPEPPVKSGTRLFHRYRDRYKALSPVPGSVTGPEPIPGCHGYRNRNQALSPELVPVVDSATSTGTFARACEI